jgi:acetyl-CoA acetyltransferase
VRSNPVYMHGGAVEMSWADASRSLTDLIFSGVSAALKDAGLSMQDIDSVVLAAHDLVDGRSLSSMVTAPAAGAYLRDEIRISGDALNAISLGAARVSAGECKRTIVAAWGRASEGDFVGTSRAMMDPFLAQPFGLTEFDISSFRLSQWLRIHPGRDADRQAALAARDRRAGANPRAIKGTDAIAAPRYPLRGGEAPKAADIVVATVLSGEVSPFRIAGIGLSSEMPAVGDRDLTAMPALASAAKLALAEAGIGLGDVAIAEIDGLTLCDEAIGAEAIGLAEPGSGFATYSSSGRINASGGGAAGWCYPAMGLIRLIECRQRLSGARGKPAYGLATGCSPLGGLTQSVVVLEAA